MPAELMIQPAGGAAVHSEIHILLIFVGIRKYYRSTARNLLLYLFIWCVIKFITVIIEV